MALILPDERIETVTGLGWELGPQIVQQVTFANGVMARGIDMGDFESLMKGRPCNGVEPSDYAYLTALGIAAKTVTGREFIVAYLIGSEMSVRENSTDLGLQHRQALGFWD
ncbi:hypothetical protein M430DRAFT_29357 [Amorphotheca resinae ATCC 22711]|uniref:Uncharacterized protein n=1 Tax=Amorphotheca resinae ATCC 22711 TaxID=857342 RepID=A0A2T3AVQ6_AMORE|nr:hypothetical protein M430DRAFT_29357 [Amorphotheca resinae ATCC 22711]PSS12767.1 hypothetical protein M430DRAFT_29357 [Amorphotheca resinae ATCC 22711]